ncbi:DUF1707 SHOCT-like domain-containing protein [Umezawaea tangerina]|uniref:Uncharacterized protein DUF1707 n=1 Tax=Umezawaea tangerina TaxID=84725 RepID=A0A2T0T1E8_9PSEU|nr:DUF1707 domain-containing protein [Umezawaea tangerina]PRY39495.1 uncharacterized protein DUF1707 [Umezawaea tangerina]
MTASTDETRGMRCSDAEREQVGARLHEAAGEGRLTLAEVEERLSQAYAARYRHELDVLTEDLPPARRPVTGRRDAVLRVRTHLLAFIAALLGRGGTPLAPRGRLLGLLAVLVVSAFVGAVVMSVLHGVFFEGGVEPSGFGER